MTTQGCVARHRFQVFERDRADTHRDAVLFHESIAAGARPALAGDCAIRIRA